MKGYNKMAEKTKKTFKIKESELIKKINKYVKQANQEDLLDFYNYLFELTGVSTMYYDDEVEWGK